MIRLISKLTVIFSQRSSAEVQSNPLVSFSPEVREAEYSAGVLPLLAKRVL
jgi:hypothetical protein